MNILITGITETHVNNPNRAGSTKFVSIPEMMATAYRNMGHTVEHRAVAALENLDDFDEVFVYVYPLGANANDPSGAIHALTQRPDAYICLDDWSFQDILPTWNLKMDVKLLQDRTWIAPLFTWGDTSKMQLPVRRIMSWDPSSLYSMPVVHRLSWRQRKQEWYNASLSKNAHEWAASQNLTWPVHAIGGKALGQKRILESDVVWQYGSYKGVLCPTYAHAGCGWWRVRYLHAVAAGCVLGGSPLELGAIGESYSYTLQGIEKMDDSSLQVLVDAQANDLRIASLPATLTILESFLYASHS